MLQEWAKVDFDRKGSVSRFLTLSDNRLTIFVSDVNRDQPEKWFDTESSSLEIESTLDPEIRLRISFSDEKQQPVLLTLQFHESSSFCTWCLALRELVLRTTVCRPATDARNILGDLGQSEIIFHLVGTDDASVPMPTCFRLVDQNALHVRILPVFSSSTVGKCVNFELWRTQSIDLASCFRLLDGRLVWLRANTFVDIKSLTLSRPSEKHDEKMYLEESRWIFEAHCGKFRMDPVAMVSEGDAIRIAVLGCSPWSKSQWIDEMMSLTGRRRSSSFFGNATVNERQVMYRVNHSEWRITLTDLSSSAAPVLLQSHVDAADMVLIAFDFTDAFSFEWIETLWSRIDLAGLSHKVTVAGMNALDAHRVVDQLQVEMFAERHQVKTLFSTSSAHLKMSVHAAVDELCARFTLGCRGWSSGLLRLLCGEEGIPGRSAGERWTMHLCRLGLPLPLHFTARDAFQLFLDAGFSESIARAKVFEVWGLSCDPRLEIVCEQAEWTPPSRNHMNRLFDVLATATGTSITLEGKHFRKALETVGITVTLEETLSICGVMSSSQSRTATHADWELWLGERQVPDHDSGASWIFLLGELARIRLSYFKGEIKVTTEPHAIYTANTSCACCGAEFNILRPRKKCSGCERNVCRSCFVANRPLIGDRGQVSSTTLCRLCATILDGESHDVAHWEADGDTEFCPQCQEKFTLLRRRHHCRRCGGLVCDSCSRKRAQLPNFAQPQRVCGSCWRSLQKEPEGAMTRSPPSVVSLPSISVSLPWEDCWDWGSEIGLLHCCDGALEDAQCEYIVLLPGGSLSDDGHHLTVFEPDLLRESSS